MFTASTRNFRLFTSIFTIFFQFTRHLRVNIPSRKRISSFGQLLQPLFTASYSSNEFARSFCLVRCQYRQYRQLLMVLCRDPYIFSRGIPASRTISFSFLHNVGHFHPPHHHPPVYNIKRYTVNVYKIDRGRSVRVRSTGYCG